MKSTALSALLPDLLDLSSADPQPRLDDLPLATVAQAFATVPDPRSRHGRRYDLPFLLTCLGAALLCGCDAPSAVGQWCRDHRTLLRRHFPHQRWHTPSGATFRWLLPRLPVPAVEAALGAWVRQTRPTRDREPLALDGKTVRGAATADQPAPHLLSVSTHQTQETLAQVRVADKTNEIPVAQALLPHLPLRGRVVTADALHTQTATARAIVERGGHYLLVVKDNQERLHADLVAYFADPHATARSAHTVDRRRGRVETRIVHASARLSTYLMTYFAFPQLHQVARLVRTTHDRHGTQHETTYLITSLPPRQADPARLLALIRGHWSIESRHYVRDVTFGEDRSRLRTGHAPQVMAALRNLVLTLIRRTGTTQIAAYRRHLAAYPAKALRLLLSRTHAR